jgi:hypothetical protein
MGIFGEFSGATPKYAVNIGREDWDFRMTQARMFVQLSSPQEYQTFVRSVGTADPASAPLARVLGGMSLDDKGNGGTGGCGYIDFLLQSAQHNLQEKIDVIPVLSDDYVVYTFGQAPPTFVYSGVLINTVQDDQSANMFRIYRDIIRASQLAMRRKLVRLRYDNFIVSGVATTYGWNLAAENEMVQPFNFQILVKGIQVNRNPDYGLVVLTDSFVDKQDKSAIQNPNARPVPLALIPNEKSTLPTTVAPAPPEITAGPKALETNTEVNESVFAGLGTGTQFYQGAGVPPAVVPSTGNVFADIAAGSKFTGPPRP